MVTLEVDQLAEQRMNAVGEFPPGIEVRYHTVPVGHVDSYPLDMLAELLNERTGRLYRGLVEGRGIAGAVQASSDTRKYAGLFAVTAQAVARPSRRPWRRPGTRNWRSFRRRRFPTASSARSRTVSRAQNYRKLESNMSLLIQLAVAEVLLDWREINDGPAKYEAVTAADIRRVANKYFKESNRSVATFRRKDAATEPAATK